MKFFGSSIRRWLFTVAAATACVVGPIVASMAINHYREDTRQAQVVDNMKKLGQALEQFKQRQESQR